MFTKSPSEIRQPGGFRTIHAIHVGSALYRMGQKLMVEEANKPKVKIEKRKRKIGNEKLTDDEILEIRAMTEFGGWSRDDIMKRFNINGDRYYRITDYQTRSKLIPTIENLPSDKT